MAVHMVVGGIAGALLLLVVVIYAIMIYNGLIRLRRNIDKAWSNIDVLRKQRTDELDKLIDTVKEYADFEERVLQRVTEAREQADQASDPNEAADADGELQGAMANLFARAEDYPELQAQDSFQQLQERISSLEEQIADRREFYNESVNTFNIRIQQIPYIFVARPMGYRQRDLFEVEPEEVEDVDVSEAFAS